MALLTAAVVRRASAASIRWMSSSSANIRALSTEAASVRVKADALCAASHDSEVICVIESTMQSLKRRLVEKIPRDFPFQIERDGSTDINLTRSLKGEQIEVRVSMPILLEQYESSSSDGYTSYSDDEDESGQQKHDVTLTVTVSKTDGSSLQFFCTAYPARVVIDALLMNLEAEEEEDVTASEDEEDEVVTFSKLDVNVQDALYRYLELRGITAVNGKILHEHMISKLRRQHLLYLHLDKLSDFVKKD